MSILTISRSRRALAGGAATLAALLLVEAIRVLGVAKTGAWCLLIGGFAGIVIIACVFISNLFVEISQTLDLVDQQRPWLNK